MQYPLYILIALSIAHLVLALINMSRKPIADNTPLQMLKDELNQKIYGLEALIAREMKNNREELGQGIGRSREELNQGLGTNRAELTKSNEQLSQSLSASAKENRETLVREVETLKASVAKELNEIKGQSKLHEENVKTVLNDKLESIEKRFTENATQVKEDLRTHVDILSSKQNDLILSTDKKLESIRVTVEEKLEKTLNSRLTESFAQVSGHLKTVSEGLGEMRSMASEVGGLKKALTSVKSRGNIGEYQLRMLMEDLLAPTQYVENWKAKDGTDDRVEFAVRLPGNGPGQEVFLPIDAKFPQDKYEALLNAFEQGEPDLIKGAQKDLFSAIEKSAKDISSKYVSPPETTNFGILFLPTEGLFAEVVRNSGLMEKLRSETKIIVAGPTTLTSIILSFQTGFKTLALQQKSVEIADVLGKVKKEIEKFGGMVDRARKQVGMAHKTLDELYSTRLNAIDRSLRSVTASDEVNPLQISIDSETNLLLDQGDETLDL